jgi:1,4-alpha-glucan branching enzyme
MKWNVFKKAKTVPPSESPAMKQSRSHNPLRNAGPKLTTVRFEYTHPTAKTVCLAGSFNHWQPEAKILHSTGVGNWWKETALAPGTYEYCFVVDGRWLPDPRANETVANPFGGRNSVLHVAATPEAAHLADAEHTPLLKENNKQTPIL